MNQQEEYEHIEQCALNAYTELFIFYFIRFFLRSTESKQVLPLYSLIEKIQWCRMELAFSHVLG